MVIQVPMTSSKFCEVIKGSGDEYILRDGKVKDNEWLNGKFVEDSQRTYTNVDEIAQKELK